MVTRAPFILVSTITDCCSTVWVCCWGILVGHGRCAAAVAARIPSARMRAWTYARPCWPGTLPLVQVNEFCERLAYYGESQRLQGGRVVERIAPTAPPGALLRWRPPPLPSV